MTPGLGPPRPAQHESSPFDLGALRPRHQSVASHTDGYREFFSRSLTQMGWRSGFPTGRPWDFASAAYLRSASLRQPTAFMRPPGPIPRITRRSRPFLATRVTVGPTHRFPAGLSPTVR